MKRASNKANAILLGGLLGGVLLTGIGTGVAFAEYLSFEYDTTSLAYEAETATETYEFTFAENERVEVWVNGTAEVIADNAVTTGTLSIEATFDPNLVVPFPDQNSYTAYVDEYGNTVDIANGLEHSSRGAEVATVSERNIWIHSEYIVDDFELFMKNKEVILEGLKNHVIVKCEPNYCIDAIVHVNPADIDRVNANGAYAY